MGPSRSEYTGRAFQRGHQRAGPQAEPGKGMEGVCREGWGLVCRCVRAMTGDGEGGLGPTERRHPNRSLGRHVHRAALCPWT